MMFSFRLGSTETAASSTPPFWGGQHVNVAGEDYKAAIEFRVDKRDTVIGLPENGVGTNTDAKKFF